MTDTTTLAPTDAELHDLADRCTPNTETGSLNYRDYAHAVLAKWGASAPASDALRTAAQAIVARWDTPHWKDAEHTGAFIQRLREALAAPPAQEALVPLSEEQIFKAYTTATGKKLLKQGHERPRLLQIFRLAEAIHGITAAQKETPNVP